MSTTVDRGQQTSGDFRIEDTLKEPLTAGFTPLPIYDAATIKGKPTFTIESFLEHDPRTGQTKTYHPGSGDGLLVLHPPELEDYHLYGSGVTPGSAWPSNLSEVMLLLHNDDGDGSHGEAITRLGFGIPLRNVVNPGSGAYFKLTTDGDLCLNFTTLAGAELGTEGIFKTNGGMRADNGFIWNISEIIDDTTATLWNTVYWMTSGAAKILTLPNITALDVGKILIVANRSSETWIIDGNSTDTIEGDLTQDILDGDTFQLLAVSTTAWIAV